LAVAVTTRLARIAAQAGLLQIALPMIGCLHRASWVYLYHSLAVQGGQRVQGRECQTVQAMASVSGQVLIGTHLEYHG
jgi:hypothetical protein